MYIVHETLYRLSPVLSVSASSVQEEDCGALVSEGPSGGNLQWSLISFGCWRVNVESSRSSLGLSAPSWSNLWLTSSSWAVTGCSVGVLVSVGSELVQKLVSDDGCTSGSGSMLAVSTLSLPSGVHLPDGWALLGCPALLEIHYYYDNSISILHQICILLSNLYCDSSWSRIARSMYVYACSSLVHITHFHSNGHSEGKVKMGNRDWVGGYICTYVVTCKTDVTVQYKVIVLVEHSKETLNYVKHSFRWQLTGRLARWSQLKRPRHPSAQWFYRMV